MFSGIHLGVAQDETHNGSETGIKLINLRHVGGCQPHVLERTKKQRELEFSSPTAKLGFRGTFNFSWKSSLLAFR